jgi:hypothetical protein
VNAHAGAHRRNRRGGVCESSAGVAAAAGLLTNPAAGGLTNRAAGGLTNPAAGGLTNPAAGGLTNPAAGGLTNRAAGGLTNPPFGWWEALGLRQRPVDERRRGSTVV